MSDKSAIEWCDASLNVVTGCDKVSPGCDNCYAETFAERWRGIKGHHFENGFDLQLRPERINIPLKWKRPRKIFVNSMSDLFHKDIPDEFIQKTFDMMSRAYWHTFQVLTKRPDRMIDYKWPDNVWAGVSVESMTYKFRIETLRQVAAKTKFLSIEPLIGYLGPINLFEISWIIVGGESGPGARHMNLDWVRTIRDQCIEQSVPFFFKQVGGVRKKETGRMLDGRTWDEFPVPQ